MLSRRTLLTSAGVMAGTSFLAGGRSASASTSTPAPVLTRPVGTTRAVADFIDSVGVNVHWSYLDTPYGPSYSRLKALLRASGIRHVRSWETDRIEDLYEAGVRTTVLIDTSSDGKGDPVAQVSALKRHAASGALAGLEGPNEIDISWTDGRRRYQGQGFPNGPVLWHQALYETAKADADLRDVPVIGMSFGNNYWNGSHPFKAGSLADTSDWGNFHIYPYGNDYAPRFSYGGINRYYSGCDFPSATLDTYPIAFTTYQAPFGRLPMAATEAGYSTWKMGQSERTHGRNIPRMFTEFFRLGIKRTFTYELVDLFDDPAGEEREHNFGLLRNDLSPKPAYNALQSMFRVLTGGDAAAPVVAGQQGDVGADLRITAAPGYDPAAVHHLALRRQDGTTVLVIWHEVSSNDTTPTFTEPKGPMRELVHPPVVVTVDLRRSPRNASAVYIDDSGALRTKALAKAGTAMTLLVGDRLTLITIPAS